MKHFIALTERVDVERALRGAAFLIFAFKMVDVALMVAVPVSRMGWGVFTSAWGFGVISNFTMQFTLALFEPLVLLALAQIIALKKATPKKEGRA